MEDSVLEDMFRRRLGILMLAGVAILASIAIFASSAATGQEPQARITRDVAAGRPMVVHVIVALCDNENQGIIQVPEHLGNGQDPNLNLYWGAIYGVRTFFARQGGWTRIPVARPSARNNFKLA